jgi:hypothetical protein
LHMQHGTVSDCMVCHAACQMTYVQTLIMRWISGHGVHLWERPFVSQCLPFLQLFRARGALRGRSLAEVNVPTTDTVHVNLFRRAAL